MRSVQGETFAWKPRQIHVTADRLCCGRKGSEILIDEIALDLVGKISLGAAGEEGFVRRAIRSVTQALSSLARLTLRQLRQMASDLGVTLYSRKSKEDLVSAIAERQDRRDGDLKAVEA